MTITSMSPASWSPDPFKQRYAGYHVEDIIRITDETPRLELSDGVLSTLPAPSAGHQWVMAGVATWLMNNSPKDFRAWQGVGIFIDLRNTLEPDFMVLRGEVDGGRHYFEAGQVALAGEVVCCCSRNRDRLEKPARYADLGVPHFWRIETDPLHVFAYDLVDGRYEMAGDADVESELVLTKPFEIRLPIRDIAP
jgi:Uma2 family endonuclease